MTPTHRRMREREREEMAQLRLIAQQTLLLDLWAAGGPFMVENDEGKPTEKPDFDAAEKLARRRVASGRMHNVDIWAESNAWRVDIANVRADGCGRIWTDLTWEGATLI